MSRDRGGPRIAAQMLVYPVPDDCCDSPSYAEFAEGYIVSTEDMRWYWRQYLDGRGTADEPYACPLKATDSPACRRRSSSPPNAIRCATMANDMPQRLAGAGVPAELSRYPGTLHGFFAMPGPTPRATAAVARQADSSRSARCRSA